MATTRPRPKTKPLRGAPEYTRDEQGRPVGVWLTVRQYERLLQRIEDLEDTVAVLEADLEGGEAVPWEQVKGELHIARKTR